MLCPVTNPKQEIRCESSSTTNAVQLCLYQELFHSTLFDVWVLHVHICIRVVAIGNMYLFGYIMLGARPMGIIFFSLRRMSVAGKKVNHQSTKKLDELRPNYATYNLFLPKLSREDDAFKNNLLYQREGQCNQTLKNCDQSGGNPAAFVTLHRKRRISQCFPND